MRPILDKEVQIEITNACQHSCSNCTRFCGMVAKPYFMTFELFKKAVDSLQTFPKLIGVMGGEPLLHPEFGKFCEYLASKRKPELCGLWSCFPEGREHYRETIVKTFGSVFLNDQSRKDVLHAPILVSSEEMKYQEDGSELKQWMKEYLWDRCWLGNCWSASINPHGAFFCEEAAALSMLLENDKASLAWNIDREPEWWTKSPIDYANQMRRYCSKCGVAMALIKRFSVEEVEDISPKMFERLKNISPKLKRGKYQINTELKMHTDPRPTATYKDQKYRDEIAKRYGMFLTVNKLGYNQPHLRKDWVEKVAAV